VPNRSINGRASVNRFTNRKKQLLGGDKAGDDAGVLELQVATRLSRRRAGKLSRFATKAWPWMGLAHCLFAALSIVFTLLNGPHFINS